MGVDHPRGRRRRAIPGPAVRAVRSAAWTTGPTCGTPCSSSAGTSLAAPTTMSHRGPSRPPTPTPAGQLGFAFDRSGYRVPAMMVSPWVPAGTVCTRRVPPHLDDGDAPRGVAPGRAVHGPRRGRTELRRLLSLDTPRAPETWPDIEPLPVPLSRRSRWRPAGLGTLGRHMCHGLYEHARHDPSLPDPPDSDPKVSPALAIDFAVHLGARLFPRSCRCPAAD